MTPEQLDRLEQLAREATPGPWHVVSLGGPGASEYVTDIGTAEDDDAVCCFGHGYDDYGQMSVPDAAYIAALSPDVVSRLVAMARGVDGLDAAWRAAEEALPEPEYVIGVTGTVNVVSGPYVATTDYGEPAHGFAYGPTPAAALLALAEKLRKRP